MSDPSQSPGSTERYPYISLSKWLAMSRPDGALETALYVTSHVWRLGHLTANTFMAENMKDLDLEELATFLSRDHGTWSDSSQNRQARWLEVFGPLGLTHEDSPLAKVLCQYLRLPTVVFDPPPSHWLSQSPFGIPDPDVACSRLVEYGHVTHVRLDTSTDGVGHPHSWTELFLTDSNEIITACSLNGGPSVTAGLSDGLHEDLITSASWNVPSISWNESNAATVLWGVVKDRIAYLADQARVFKTTGCLSQSPYSRELTQELVDICTTLLSQKRSFRRRPGKWLTTDVRANLEDASSWCNEIVHCNQATLRGSGAWLESNKLQASREANRIAVEQAHSAVVLNILLALLTSLTIFSLPFTMTTGYFGMNVFQKDSTETVATFWIVVGSVTGFCLVMGLTLFKLLATYGAKVQKLAPKIFGVGKKKIKTQDITVIRPQLVETSLAARIDDTRRKKIAIDDHSAGKHAGEDSTGAAGDIEMGVREDGGLARWWDRERAMRGK